MPSILVTGCNRGIGLELAKHYAQNAWRVMAVCRQPDSASDLCALA